MDLLRWFRFLWAVEVAWDRATRSEARDFCRWLAVTNGSRGSGRAATPYSVSVRVHSETVLRWLLRLSTATWAPGPMVNPFPLDRSRRGGRAHAHHNPMEPYRNQRAGLYRPRVVKRIPRNIPDAAVQRDLRAAALASGPGVGGVLRLHRGASLGAADRDAGRCRSRAAVDHGGAQGLS